MTDSASTLVRRYLRQRIELDGGEIILDRLSREDLDRVLSAARSASSGGPALPAEYQRWGAPAAAPARPASEEAAPAPPAVTTRRAPISAEALLRLSSMDELRTAALDCPRCGLCETRKQVVFGDGPLTADLLIVTGTPGAVDDAEGRLFSGREGGMLETLLASVGFSREAVYITTAVKCRTPDDRNPETDEIEACSTFLRKEVELVGPSVILAFGGVATRAMLGTEAPLGQLRGETYTFEGVPLVPTYQPAALLRNPSWIRPVWDDLQRVRALLDTR